MVVYESMFVIYLLFGVLLAETSVSKATWTCNDGELPCLTSNGTCIPQQHWCDGEFDCPDGSDEYFCNGNECSEDYFPCKNGRCIPFVAVCNGYDNCGDSSDEECGSNHSVTNRSNSQLAVVEAALYLLSQRKSDYGWDDFTPRALIALAFAEKYLPIPEKDRDSMLKKLNLQLLLLLRNDIKNLATLALHINALYAMCKDPRDFHGIDLVGLLRFETDKAMKSDFKMPIVFLTLCIAKEAKYQDLDKLDKIYDESYITGVKALAMIAMTFCNGQAKIGHPHYEMKSRDFIQRYDIRDQNTDVYTKALVYQAYNALGYDTSPFQNELLGLQSESGSFEDLLGTYSVIPAVLNASLANLQCKTRHYEVKPPRRAFDTLGQIFNPERYIDYSLWIPDGENAGYHTLRITFEGDKSFYDLMKMAELRNPMFRFKHDEIKDLGKVVYYLAGIPNDPEKGLTWQLYKKDAVNIQENSTTNGLKETNGVDRIFPRDGDIFIFELEHAKM